MSDVILDALQIGDILLCNSGGHLAAVMRRFQAAHIFHGDHRRWVHAAMYYGGGRILEKKSFKNWRELDLRQYLLQHDVLVRRPTFSVSEQQRTQLLSVAISLLKKPYNFGRAFEIAWRSAWVTSYEAVRTRAKTLNIELPPRSMGLPKSLGRTLCNEMIDACYIDATGNPLVPEDRWAAIDYMLTPASLSWTPSLADLPINFGPADVQATTET